MKLITLILLVTILAMVCYEDELIEFENHIKDIPKRMRSKYLQKVRDSLEN